MDKEILAAIVQLVRDGGAAAFWLAVLYIIADFLRPVLMLGMAVGTFAWAMNKLATAVRALKEK